MGTIYNVPISWARDTSYPEYKEAYKGTMHINYTIGNTIEATWGSLGGKGVTKYDDLTLYWNYIDIQGELHQGAEVKAVEHYNNGRYYPNGETYTYSLNFNESLIMADLYEIYISDGQSMFDKNTMTKPSTIPLDVTRMDIEKPKNFTKAGGKIYEDIIISFDLTSNNKIDYQVIQNGTILTQRNNQIEKRITIPAGTLKTKDSVTVKVRTHFNFVGLEVYSDWVTYTVSGLEELKAEKPTNVRIMGVQRAIEEPLSFNWDTTDTKCKATIEFWQDGVKIFERNNITNKTYTLPAGTLKKPNPIKIRVKNTIIINGYSAVSAYEELNVNNLTSIKPTLNDITLNNHNRDYNIIITISAVNAQRYEVYRETTLIASGATSEVIIPAGKLVKGINRIKVIGYKDSSAGVLKSEIVKNFNIEQDEPIVYSLEPSNISININEVSAISFVTNEFCDRWEIQAGANTFTGTTDRSFQVMANFFMKGQNKLKITTYYTPSWTTSETRTAVKEVFFNGYGNPVQPQMDNILVYNTASPIFTWNFRGQESDAQVAFQIKILDASKNVIEDETVLGANTEYIPAHPFSNNAKYTVMLKIQNKFNLWSDFSSKDITTSFNQLPASDLVLTQNGACVFVSVEGIKFQNFEQSKLFRREKGGEWLEIAHALDATDYVVDYMAKPNVENYYKVRTLDKTGAFVDSEEKSITIKIKNYVITDVQKEDKTYTMDFATLSINYVNDIKTKLFAGNVSPTIYTNKSYYETGTLTVMLENSECEDFKKLISKGKIFCLRTWKGHKVFGFFYITNISAVNAFIQSVTVQYTQVSFNEYKAYSGKREKGIIFLNGEYYLDGSIDLSAIVYNDEPSSLGGILW